VAEPKEPCNLPLEPTTASSTAMPNLDGANDLEKQTESETGQLASLEATIPLEAAAVSEKPGARVGLSVAQFWIVLFG
jgi:hypothetical protein